MKTMQKTSAAIIASATLLFLTGCETPLGQMAGNLVQVNGQPLGQVVQSVMTQIDAQQQAKLQQESPQTLQTRFSTTNRWRNNPQRSAAAKAGKPAAPEEAAVPLKVEDIKAMTAAGIKADAIIDAIKQSKTAYSPTDIATAQQATPAIDKDVIDFMKNSRA